MGLPKADFWYNLLDRGAGMNQPKSCLVGGELGFAGDPSPANPIGLVGLDLGLDFLPSAILGA